MRVFIHPSPKWDSEACWGCVFTPHLTVSETPQRERHREQHTESKTQRARHSTEGAELRLRVGANKFTQDLIVFFKFTSQISKIQTV